MAVMTTSRVRLLRMCWILPVFVTWLLLGCASIASGQATFVQPQTVIHSFSQGSATFGWAVADLKDIDVPPDGVTDLIVTSIALNSAFVYSGKTGALVHTLSPPAGSPATGLGAATADAGDVNMDGVNDIIVGGTNHAIVYSGVDGSALLQLAGENAGDLFGFAVAGAGDVNGDGRADVLVGAPGNDTTGLESGRAYVYSGIDGTLIRTLEAQAAGDRFGEGTAGTGDLNGDMIADVIIGAPNAGAAGKAFVFSGVDGALLFDTDADAGGVNYGTFFVAGVGDVNFDGTRDVYVGDFSDTGGRGKAYVYSGIDGAVLHVFTGDAGEGVGPGRGAGDVDGDGHADLIVGHWTSSTGAAGAGKVVVYSGKTGDPLRTITSTSSGENLGFDAVGVGDVDGDGLIDFLVSAATANRVYVIGRTIDFSGEVVAQHVGATDPETEGFLMTINGTPTVGPIIGDLGVDAWQLSPAQLVRYQTGDLTTQQKLDAVARGWKITLEARVVSAPDQRGLVTANLENVGGRRFDINLGLDANGDTYVRLNDNILAGLNAVGETFTLAGSGSTYHLYELKFDPGTQTADLFVDGVERISNYPGHTNFVRPFGFYMGAYEGHVGNYSLARFEILPPNGECGLIVAPSVGADAVVQSRFISFDVNNPGEQTALRLTYVDLPAPHDVLNGQSMWLGAPEAISESPSKTDPNDAPGLGSFTFSPLQCSPLFRDWTGMGTIHVTNTNLVSGAVYRLEEIKLGCDANVPADFSFPLSLNTSAWGDVGGAFDGKAGLWKPPDGIVSVAFDVVSILDKFSSNPSAPLKARCDLEPAMLDMKINITDVTSALDAFRGVQFPFDVAPNNCGN